jgi:hypothetical protein
MADQDDQIGVLAQVGRRVSLKLDGGRHQLWKALSWRVPTRRWVRGPSPLDPGFTGDQFREVARRVSAQRPQIIEADRPPGVFYGSRGNPPVLHRSHCEVNKNDQADKIHFIPDKQRTAARS